MLPGLMGPGGPMGSAPQGGSSQNETFATGMLAGLGLREMSQLLGLSKKGKAQQPGGGMELPAADQLSGQLGDIDKLIILSRLMGQQGGPPPGGMPPGAGPAPLGPGASPLGGNPALAALAASRGPVASPAGPPMSPLAAMMGPGGPPMGAPAGPPIAGGGVSLVPMLLNQLLNKSTGLV